MDSKIAHLGFIQGIINRMGNNSFLLKGWSVTLVAAIFALAPKDADKRFLIIAYCPILMFWMLDAFFLRQERLYRKLYDAVSSDTIKSDTFSLNAAIFNDSVSNIFFIAISKTIIAFHGTLAGIVLFAIFNFSKPLSN